VGDRPPPDGSDLLFRDACAVPVHSSVGGPTGRSLSLREKCAPRPPAVTARTHYLRVARRHPDRPNEKRAPRARTRLIYFIIIVVIIVYTRAHAHARGTAALARFSRAENHTTFLPNDDDEKRVHIALHRRARDKPGDGDPFSFPFFYVSFKHFFKAEFARQPAPPLHRHPDFRTHPVLRRANKYYLRARVVRTHVRWPRVTVIINIIVVVVAA